MKKLALALVLGCPLLSAAIPAQAMDADHPHDMVIYGRLQTAKSGCTVLMSKYVLTLNNENRTLPIQGTQLNTFIADDRIYIQLGGEDCDAHEGYKNIGLKFLGTVDDVEGNTLANTDTSSAAAQGVAVQLSDMFSKIIKPNETIARFPGASATGQATTQTISFPLAFYLVQLKGQKVVAGNIQTNLTVQIERL